GCTGMDSGAALSCLRGLSPTAITNGPANPPAPLPGGLFYQDSSTSLSFQPIVDGAFLTDQPAALFTAKKEAAVPVLQGTNTNEGILFQIPALGPFVSVTTQTDYLAALTRTFGSNASAIAARYPVAGEDAGGPSGDAGAAGLDGGAGSPMVFATPDDALTRISSDALFVCQARGLERLLSANGLKTYLYSFNGPLTGVPVPQLMGQAFHSSELP